MKTTENLKNQIKEKFPQMGIISPSEEKFDTTFYFLYEKIFSNQNLNIFEFDSIETLIYFYLIGYKKALDDAQ